jgi:hypothetical protein
MAAREDILIMGTPRVEGDGSSRCDTEPGMNEAAG